MALSLIYKRARDFPIAAGLSYKRDVRIISLLASTRNTMQLVSLVMSPILLFSRSCKTKKNLAGISCSCSALDGVVVSPSFDRSRAG